MKTRGLAVPTFLLILNLGGERLLGQPTIFTATFDSQPLGPLATQPKTDPQPLELPSVILRDSDLDQVSAANPVGDFTTRVMLLDSTPGTLADAAFFNPVQYTSGKYSVSWDSLVTQTPGDRFGAAIVLASNNGSEPSIFEMSYDPSGAFSIGTFQGAGLLHFVGAYSIGHLQHFQVTLDLDTHTYRFLVNDVLLDNGALFDISGFDLTAFDSNGRGSTSDAPPWAVDNFKVEAVPEPGVSLVGIGGLGVMIRAWTRKRKRISGPDCG
jgi:hypothetical protein